MSGLFGELNNSVKALTAASRSVELVGRNLANVNNANYARQRVVYGDRGSVQTDIGVQSLGVEAVGIQQLRDTLLDAQVVRESSLQSSFEAEQSAYKNAQANLGQSVDRSGATSTTGSDGSTNGIAQGLSDFFNAFQSFSASPTDVGERQSLVQKAGILTDAVNEADQRLTQLQSDLTTQANSDVTDVNSTLKSIAELNGQIGRAEINQPGAAVDLRDQRQALVEHLATKMSIETKADPNFAGEIQVYARDASNNPVQLINLASTTGPVTLSGSVLSAGSPATADGGAAGDNTIAQAVANLASKSFSTPADSIDGTFSQYYSKTVTDLGQSLTTANAHVTSQTSIATLVKSQRDSVSGVSLDEEMADMIKYQRSFQASSRIISIIDDLLNTVVNKLGA